MSDNAGAPDVRRGKLIVISGPSGTGKTSICNALLEQLPDTVWSVSVTTRRIRRGEQSGRSYVFVSRQEFQDRQQAGEFLESAEYIGESYGTPHKPVEEALARGCNVVMEIDLQGGMQVAAKAPDSIRIFVLPPDKDVLRSRLEGRKTEAREELAKRLDKADREIALARESGCYQHFVVNDRLETAIERVKNIVLRENETV